MVALAGGLAAEGHEVTLAITSGERKDYSHFADRLGFSLVQVGYLASPEALIEVRDKIYRTRDPMKQLYCLLEVFESGIDTMHDTARALCVESDLIIGHFLAHPLQVAAEKARKPHMTVALNPSGIPTRYAPPTGFPNLVIPNMGQWFNRIIWKLGMSPVNGHLLPAINRLRQREGLAPATSFREIWESPLANLIAVSPEICPPRPDWQPHQQMCGFFRIPVEAQPWSMPDSLVQFLAAGPPPVYMTFGSMLSMEHDAVKLTELTRLLFGAAQAAGCRAIIQSRWQNVTDIPEDSEIYRVGEAPHLTVFPHCAAVVHHGGAGTTQTATLSGCPSVVAPMFGDQYFWGRELKRLGVAPNLLDCRKATPEKLGRLIRRVLDTPAMGLRAKELGAALGAENGVANAVGIIERVIENRFRT